MLARVVRLWFVIGPLSARGDLHCTAAFVVLLVVIQSAPAACSRTTDNACCMYLTLSLRLDA